MSARGHSGGRRALAAGFLAVTAGAIVLGWRGASPPAVPESCRARLEVIADDGTAIPVEQQRCDERPGRAPALLVWGPDPGTGRAWAAALARWRRQGRTIWVALAPPRPEPSSPLTDPELPRRDLSAVVEALAG
ncbi:MAG: hypothetical protein D6718_01070, partial [Acidobacteria bacterium]